jgi:vitamin B12 transporter
MKHRLSLISNTRKIFALLLLLLVPLGVAAQEPLATIIGTVKNEKGEPVEYAAVQISGTKDGALTNERGEFRFTTAALGSQQIRVSQVGAEPELKSITITAGATLRLNFTLREKSATLRETNVSASSFSVGDVQGVTLTPLEVVTTPGAAADIFRAMQTFPGVASVDEGAGLFVRGGDVGETVVLLDQATVTNPYRYATPAGGVFGTIPPFLVSGTFFSSGGFPARYGNALSGVLAMETQNMPAESRFTAGAGLAALSLGGEHTLVPQKLAVRFSGNYSFTQAMFDLNGQGNQFATTPTSYDLNGSILYQLSPTGRLKFFNFFTDNTIGVRLQTPALNGIYRGDERNRIHNLQWTDLQNGWLLKTSFSLAEFDTKRNFGALDLTLRESVQKLRFDSEKELGDVMKLYVGFESERQENRSFGFAPTTPVLANDAPRVALDERYAATRTGAYLETDIKLARALTGNFGMRVDYNSLASQTVFNPRTSLRYDVSKTINLRAAWGLYHQFATPFQYNPRSGNPSLSAPSAQQFILGGEYQERHTQIRVEAYHKTYRDLILPDKTLNLVNLGDGNASGVDVFMKYGAFLETRFNGWVSYSFLSSERLVARDEVSRFVYERAVSPFDITHTFNAVGKCRVIGFLSVGASVRYSTGRPITPIVRAIQDPTFGFYTPVEGAANSERLPDFTRLNLDASYYYAFGRNALTLFLAVSNVLNEGNTIGYDYAADYQSRTPRITTFRRFTYFGAVLSVGL